VVQLYVISRNSGIGDELIAALDHQPGFTVAGRGTDSRRLLFVWAANRVSEAMALVDRKLSAIRPDWPLHLLVGGQASSHPSPSG
jgi:hypothetical protein